MKTKTVQDLAGEVTAYLEDGKRENGDTYILLRTTTPVWFYEMVYQCHRIDDILPNDYIYAFIKEALLAISEYSDSEDAIYEIEGDVYNDDLLKWVSNNLTFASWVDAVLREGIDKDWGLFTVLGSAQQLHKQAIAREVLRHLEKQLN